MKSYKHRKPYRIRKKKSIFRSRFFWITLLILIFLGAIFYFVVFCQFFQIKEFEISGNQKIQSQEIEDLIKEKINQKLLLFSTKSIFLINSKKIVNSLLEKYPQIEQINLKRKLPATLIVKIKERSPVAVFCQENCFFVDKKGIIFDPVREPQIINYPEDIDFSNGVEEGPKDYDLIIKSQNKKEVFLGKQIIQEEKLNLILEIQEKLKTNLKIISKEFVIQDSDRVDAKTTEGWEIYFDLKNSLDWQLTKLSLVLEKKIPLERRGDLEYIDLRFGNFAPYKYRTMSATEESP